VSAYRQQTWIDAPIEIVWRLIRDVNRHPDWWPRVVEVECEGLEEGCTYRSVTESPFGYQELSVVVDRLDEMREMRIRCINTGTFVDLAVADARGGTFVDARFGIEPQTARMRMFDVVAGKRFFRRWLEQSLEAMQAVAQDEAGAGAEPHSLEAGPG
jgi:uncharacterized protein YndB with AHSA1/START domain